MTQSKDTGSVNLANKIAAEENLKLRARKENKRSVWMNISLFGLVGWSVTIPAMLGAFLGHWMDHRLNDQASWTLTFLLIGLLLGCLNAAYWIRKEQRAIHHEITKDDE
ncbi:MAG: AtpZ/AtpI family protein [Saprospiraceae bacterium]